MSTPDDLERHFTLLTAVARYEALRTRDALAAADDDDGVTDAVPLTGEETLEMLALSEVIARKAVYGRQLSVRSARRARASWAQIGAALGTSKQAAWETHNRWIDEQAKRDHSPGHWGWDDDDVAAARALAGEPDEEDQA
ncbi:hypothetical protein ABZT47_36820 [Sphaerisporangium sp. NPDC005289]|uniref:hypothetical protein n=1 Tax=Sphaerisporangium sp. NPDC005289 TaxID=3155247 RepID=UPI0033BA5207